MQRDKRTKNAGILALVGMSVLSAACDSGQGPQEHVSNPSAASQPAADAKRAPESVSDLSRFVVALSDQEKRDAAALGSGGTECILAIKAQDVVVEHYVTSKQRLLAKIRGLDLSQTRLAVQTESETCSAPSLTVSASYAGTNSSTDRDQGTIVSGSGGGAGGGAGPIQGPITTEVDEDSGTSSGTLTGTISLTMPLGCAAVKSREAIDESHFMREAVGALFRQPLFCDLLRKCPLGLKPDKIDNSTACGSSGFGGGFPGGPGGGR